jgi:hypothetical protein
MAELSATASASPGVTFNFTYGGGVPFAQADSVIRSMNRASDGWSSYLKDPITLNAQVEFVDMPAPRLGGARPAMLKVNYKDYVTALLDDYTSGQDWDALNNLQLSSQDKWTLQSYANGDLNPNQVKLNTDSFSQLLDSEFVSKSGSDGTVLDQNGSENNQKIWITRANAKALGLLKKDDNSKLDFIIQMNKSAKWDFDQTDGITPGTFDFTSVFQHEIGHALGFVSGVDAFEWLNLTQGQTLTEKELTYVTPMDLYRFSPESAKRGAIDMRIGGGIEKYFSLDRGKTNLGDFSTGGLVAGGDGYQASHWKQSNPALGIMQPDVKTGQTLSISDLDLKLLDVIGWNLDVGSSLSRKATAAGMDWNRISQDMNQQQQSTIQRLAAEWGAKNPGYNIEPDLRALGRRLDATLNREIDKKFDQKIGKGNGKQPEEVQKLLAEIMRMRGKQDDKFTKFVKERENLDSTVRRWLDLDVKKLSEELRMAVGVDIQKLAEIVNNAPASQKTTWEAKLNEAFALITENPSKAVQEVLKTTGPSNPIGWRTWFYGWIQTGSSDDPSMSGFTNYLGWHTWSS